MKRLKERKQRRARSKAWDLAKYTYKLKENDKAKFFSLAEKWAFPAASTKSGRKDSLWLIQELVCIWSATAELKTMRTSRSPTTVVTANGEVRTREEATVHVKRLTCLIYDGIRPKSRSIRPQWRKVKGQNKINTRDAKLDRQPKIQSSSVEETLQRIMVQTNNDCRFLIFTLTSALHQQPLLAGR